jgi:holo-ACP synthase/triphosphoribosyl-dephospho-CoA synthase
LPIDSATANSDITNLLDDKETRWRAAVDLAERWSKPAILGTVVMPGPDKSGRIAGMIFAELAAALDDRAADCKWLIHHREIRSGPAGPSIMLIVSEGDPRAVKAQMVELEEAHPVGRLFDLDVYDLQGRPVSRQDLGIAPRTCLICGGDVQECRRGGKHTLLELQAEIERMLLGMRRQAVLAMARKAVYAMLLETACRPSPGLVNPSGTGSHADMNYLTFLASSSALAPWYGVLAQAGAELQGQPDALLHALRPHGIQAETAMFSATGGVNTQKGLIFSLGLAVGAAGYALRASCRPGAADVRSAVIRAAAPLQDELRGLADGERTPASGGERAYARYGATGIRGEAIGGYPSVFDHALPTFTSLIDAGYSVNDCLVGALVSLLAVVEDTTVLARHGLGGLRYVQSQAREALRLGSVRTTPGRDKITEMDTCFAARRLNPGGSADLLAVSVFFYLLEREIPPEQLLGPSLFDSR